MPVPPFLLCDTELLYFKLDQDLGGKVKQLQSVWIKIAARYGASVILPL